MSQLFEPKVKRKLKALGESAGFHCKSEYRLRIEGINRVVA